MNSIQKLKTIFAISAAIALASCTQLKDPYNADADADAEKDKTAHKIKHSKKGIKFQTVSEANFAESLPDGIHIVQSKSTISGEEDNNFIVIKERESSFEKGRGYFGMTSISKNFIPERPSDKGNQKNQVWTIYEGETVSDLTNGLHDITIPGEILNGEDMHLSVIVDDASSFRQGYGYLGVTTKLKL